MFVAAGLGEATLWGALAGFLGIIILVMLSPRRVCPKCSHQLPKLRWPDSGSQLWRGGWTCPKCSTKCDRTGQTIE